MTRERSLTQKIALLATGDEIIHGDILNTNSQEISARLFNCGMNTGNHLVTADVISEIEQAISFLLSSHHALIITGGLGPTSDDLTRFALSKALDRPLIFDENTWEEIANRLKRFGYDSPPLSNRQQALFPEGATIIPNANGTAAGCMLEHQHKFIFMLPGPPAECLPMMDQIVLPTLKNASFSQIEYHQNWLLFGVSEGQIAEELDKIAASYDCITGYRLFYPYIEFKLHSYNKNDFDLLLPQIEQTIHPYLLDKGKQTASEMLRNSLASRKKELKISDQATGGLLESLIKTPASYPYLRFVAPDEAQISIQGLNEFWQQQETIQTTLEFNFNFFNAQKKIQFTIPYRGYRVKQYAVEFICWQLYQFLKDMELKNTDNDFN